MIKRVIYAPTRGARFVANKSTGEIHDMTRVCASCRISKIHSRAEGASVEDLRLRLGEKLKLHKDCFGDR